MAWQRGGYCCRCGDCCKGVPPALADQPEEVSGYCPLFSWSQPSAEGPGFCRGHTGAVPAGEENFYYLSGCNVWPESPDNIQGYQNCTYTFVWSDD
jgi:hypothetical protein